MLCILVYLGLLLWNRRDLPVTSCSWHVSGIKCWLTGSDNRQSVMMSSEYRCNRSLQQQTLLLLWITSLLCCKSACTSESTTINASEDSRLAEIKQVHRIFGLFQLRQVMLRWQWMVSVTGTRLDISDTHSWSTVINEHDADFSWWPVSRCLSTL